MRTLRINPPQTDGCCQAVAAALSEWSLAAFALTAEEKRKVSTEQSCLVQLFLLLSHQHFLKDSRPPLGHRCMAIVTDISYHQQLPLFIFE